MPAFLIPLAIAAASAIGGGLSNRASARTGRSTEETQFDRDAPESAASLTPLAIRHDDLKMILSNPRHRYLTSVSYFSVCLEHWPRLLSENPEDERTRIQTSAEVRRTSRDKSDSDS